MGSPSMENKFQEIRDLLNEAWDMTSKKALREKLESAAQCLGVSLSLVSEAGEHTFSDAFLILQACAAACAEFARRHYDGSAPSILLAPGRNDHFGLN